MIKFNLKTVLKKSGKNLTELANLTGISRTSLSQLSTGKSQGIQFETLDKILLALNVNVDDLIIFTGIPPEDLQITTKMISYDNFNINFEQIDTEDSSYNMPTHFSFSSLIEINISKTDLSLIMNLDIDSIYSFTGSEINNHNVIQDFKYEIENEQYYKLLSSNFLNNEEKYEIKKSINTCLLNNAKDIYFSEYSQAISFLETLVDR